MSHHRQCSHTRVHTTVTVVTPRSHSHNCSNTRFTPPSLQSHQVRTTVAVVSPGSHHRHCNHTRFTPPSLWSHKVQTIVAVFTPGSHQRHYGPDDGVNLLYVHTIVTAVVTPSPTPPSLKSHEFHTNTSATVSMHTMHNFKRSVCTPKLKVCFHSKFKVHLHSNLKVPLHSKLKVRLHSKLKVYLSSKLKAVSYTHLTLPTNHRV